LAELRDLQRLALSTVRRPLSRSGRTQSRWTDGRAMAHVAAEFIKPNDRLTSVERLEIYNKQYWYRLLDCLWDDYPGLRAILGERRFERLRVAYLERYPSRSYTLRNLGSRLEQFIRERPELVAPHATMCVDMARFEWAQVVAFDAEAKPPLPVDDLLGRAPARLRLRLQPHLTLLEMNYPLDDFVIALKKKDAAMRTEASNAVEADHRQARPRRVRLPNPRKACLAVHRHDDALYYKRLDAPAYRILAALRDGATLAAACEGAFDGDDVKASDDVVARVQSWFATWTELGWFCRR
jgi:hypothetical protein